MQGSSFSLSLGDTKLGPGPFSDHITFLLFREVISINDSQLRESVVSICNFLQLTQ